MITPLEPINVPAKTADGLWITNLVISAPSTTRPIRVLISIAPFVSATGEVLTAQTKTINIRDLFSEIQTNQALATAVQAVYAAVQQINNDRELF